MWFFISSSRRMAPSAGDVMLALLSSEKAALLFARRVAASRVLLEGREPSLPGYIALAGQELQRLLARHHLAAADDPTVLVLHQVALREATRRVLRRSVENLCLRANCRDITGHSYIGGGDFSAARPGATTPAMPLSGARGRSSAGSGSSRSSRRSASTGGSSTRQSQLLELIDGPPAHPIESH